MNKIDECMNETVVNFEKLYRYWLAADDNWQRLSSFFIESYRAAKKKYSPDFIPTDSAVEHLVLYGLNKGFWFRFPFHCGIYELLSKNYFFEFKTKLCSFARDLVNQYEKNLKKGENKKEAS